VSVPAPDIAPTDQVVGVDLGIVRPAVTSNNQFLGKRAWKAIEGRLFHLKRSLQQKGTRSAKRHLRRVRRKQARFRRNTDHMLSKQIVASVEPGATIVVANLTDMRKRTKVRRRTQTSRRVHSRIEDRGSRIAVGACHLLSSIFYPRVSPGSRPKRHHRKPAPVGRHKMIGLHRQGDLRLRRVAAADHNVPAVGAWLL
jgi:hypothetical protein